MTFRAEYQQNAGECIRWAAKANTEEERQAFLEMADAWTVVAFEDPLVIERALPLASATSAPNGLREL